MLISVSRISIDVSDEEHRKLKAMAALKGQSLKDFLLQRTLGDIFRQARREAKTAKNG
jgi:uncharacterized protein (DUF1778 family)